MTGDSPDAPDADPTVSLADNVSEIIRRLFGPDTVRGTLDQVVVLAGATIESCEYAGLSLTAVAAGSGIPTATLVPHSHPMAAEMDELQRRNDEGPCLDAISHNASFYAEDLATEERWPSFSHAASAKGVRSLLALPLSNTMQSSTATYGALNLYATYPSAFGVVERSKATLLAAIAGSAITATQTHVDEERKAQNLQAALLSRTIIGQAQGILMERERITADQAFDILRRASQHLNRKLREIAQDIVETGERPEIGRPAIPARPHPAKPGLAKSGPAKPDPTKPAPPSPINAA